MTSSNTGVHNGTCIPIERKLEKDLLHLACRHHIMELLAGAAFAVSMSPSAPEVLLFKRFQQQWLFIDQGNFSTSADASELTHILDPVKVHIIDFAEGQLAASEKLVRDDYREFLELSIIFLGGKTSARHPLHGSRSNAP